jgi:hypothetical protein
MELSKMNDWQGAQMHFQVQNCHKLNNLATIKENNKSGTEKCDLLPSNRLSLCLNVNLSSLDESSVAIIVGSLNGVKTNMLLNTGSSISAIIETFAQQLKLETWLTRDTLIIT